jgi:restriction system protein
VLKVAESAFTFGWTAATYWRFTKPNHCKELSSMRRRKGNGGKNGLGLPAVLLLGGLTVEALRHWIFFGAIALAIAALIIWRRRSKAEQWRSSGIAEIDMMSGEQFEMRMERFFRDHHWKVRRTRVTGDFGCDLVLFDSQGTKIVAQLKRYGSNVGIAAVQEVLGAQHYYQASQSEVITNSHLTRQAKELALRSGVRIWEREMLIRQLTKDREDPIVL